MTDTTSSPSPVQTPFEACCESTLLSACCQPQSKAACCGPSSRPATCRCQPNIEARMLRRREKG